MRKKIYIVTMCLAFAMASLTGCGKSKTEETTTATTIEETTTDSTLAEGELSIAGTLKAEFMAKDASAGLDVDAVANELVKNECFGEVAMVAVPVSEGYLNGFGEEIKGFKKGAMIAPMIGTIPFVGYIFETDTPDDFVKTLEGSHQLNWNVCTVADEMQYGINGNYVFFVMAPKSFDE